MRKIFITDKCFALINSHKPVDSGYTRCTDGWEISVSQETLDKLLAHSCRGESISDTIERVVALTRRLG